MSGYDIIGNIALVKFERGMKVSAKKKFAEKFLKEHNHVSTVLEKSDKISGRLRTPKTKWIAGDKNKEAVYRENDCVFRLNVDTCYFSPRLSAERKEISGVVKKGENVLVMFGGVAPFAITIAKNSKAKKIVSVELGRECSKYAQENVKRNKLQNVEIVQGNVKKVVGVKIKEKFDRIVMARPNLEDDFLESAFKVSKKGTIIHYYGFYPESEKEKLSNLILKRARESKKKIKILKTKRAGEVGVKRFRYRVDVKVLN